jgi:hypothetical protein
VAVEGEALGEGVTLARRSRASYFGTMCVRNLILICYCDLQ